MCILVIFVKFDMLIFMLNVGKFLLILIIVVVIDIVVMVGIFCDLFKFIL